MHQSVKVHNDWKEYRVYRKKFRNAVVSTLFMNAAAFLCVFLVLVNGWSSEYLLQAQSTFEESERKISNIQSSAEDYVDRMYQNRMLMQDVAALFNAGDEAEYLEERRKISQKNTEKILSFSADVKQMFNDSRGKVTGIALYSKRGTKILWMDENANMHLEFNGEIVNAKKNPQFGNVLVSSCDIRNPENIGYVIGRMEFWTDSSEIYRLKQNGKLWGIYDLYRNKIIGSECSEDQEKWMLQAEEEIEPYGWMTGEWGRPVYYIRYVSAQYHYSYVIIKDIGQIVQEHGRLLLVLAGAFALVGAAIILLSYGSICRDADFLRLIIQMFSYIEKGDFQRIEGQEIPKRQSEDEYKMIALALKDVGMKLKNYIEAEYVYKIREQETEMRVLRHQINPHFLYNTLEMIRSMALTNEDPDVADAVAGLGALYRARIHKQDVISLKEEFELLEMYLKIMSLRHGKNFLYQTEVDAEIWEIPTLPFWLQPLTENFFVHGIDRKKEFHLLIVTGSAENGGARINIIDNGLGMDSEKLNEVRRNMMEGNDDPEADIGLRNVYVRLKSFYKERFTMELDNNPEGGFHISIFIGEI